MQKNVLFIIRFCLNPTTGCLLWGFIFLSLFSCQKEPVKAKADTIYYNASFYTLDEKEPTASAIAVREGRIIAIGKDAEIMLLKGDSTVEFNLQQAFAMPGFIEGHGHFSSLGQSLMNLNFIQSKSWDEIIQAVAKKAAHTPKGTWIGGWGWHQEKWDATPIVSVDNYPTHDQLSALTKDHPVILSHASGHSLFANALAMTLAGVSAETPDPRGGRILRDKKGQPTGVFEEGAMQLIQAAYNDYKENLAASVLQKEWQENIRLAQKECLSRGITSFQDAGATFKEIADYRALAEQGALDLRLWVMARESYPAMLSALNDDFPIIDVGHHFFTCRAIKSEIDGALGSFGAWLLAPYSDKPNFSGQNTTPLSTIDSIAGLAMEKGMQLCVHAIGDKANRETLNIFEQHFQQKENQDLRWRIEHSQHLDVADIPRYAQLGVIASIQAIHCTSDAPFVEKRLGSKRASTGAYAWRSLLDAGAIVTNGTDTPVESVDPIANFYASVTRKNTRESKAFYPEQAMTREEALYAYTMANAYAAFEEQDKGSISVGKLADIVVLSNDLRHCSEADILTTEVLMTIVGGEVKYEK